MIIHLLDQVHYSTRLSVQEARVGAQAGFATFSTLGLDHI